MCTALDGASPAIWDHSSVTCHPTHVNVPHFNPSQAGWYSIYLPGRDERLSWPWVTGLQAVSHPSTNHLIVTQPGMKPKLTCYHYAAKLLLNFCKFCSDVVCKHMWCIHIKQWLHIDWLLVGHHKILGPDPQTLSYDLSYLRIITRQNLRYPKMIIRHVLGEFTELVFSDRKICHS